MTASFRDEGDPLASPLPPAPRIAAAAAHRTWLVPAIVAAAATAVYVLYSATQWRQLTVPSWDLGIFTQEVRSYASFAAPVSTIRGGDGFNLLGDHFSPITAVLAPVWWIFPHAFMLLVAQAVLIGASCFPVTRAAMRHVGRRTGLLLGAAYAASWGVQAAVDFQFHEVAFLAPLLAFSLEAFLGRRWWACVLWAAPLVFVKEDLGLTVLMLALALLIRTGTWKLPVALGAWGLGWYLIATEWVIPALSASGSWTYTSKINIAAILTNPLAALGGMFTPATKVELLWLTVVAGGVLCVRSPLFLLVAPTLAWRLLSTDAGAASTSYHHSLILMPIVFLALVDAVVASRASSREWLRAVGARAAVVAVAASLALIPTRPIIQLSDPARYLAAPRTADMLQAIAAVPAGATLTSDLPLMNYVVDDHRVYWIGDKTSVTDYAIADVKSWGIDRLDDYMAGLTGHSYSVVYDRDGYQVVKRSS